MKMKVRIRKIYTVSDEQLSPKMHLVLNQEFHIPYCGVEVYWQNITSTINRVTCIKCLYNMIMAGREAQERLFKLDE